MKSKYSNNNLLINNFYFYWNIYLYINSDIAYLKLLIKNDIHLDNPIYQKRYSYQKSK